MSERPLLLAYPKLTAALPLVPLCELPTPVEPLPALGEDAFVKRDDLSHPVYGGNKLRKLELIAGELQRQAARHVVTFGGRGTNAGVATALVCRQLGVGCTVLTFDQPDAPGVEHNQRRMRELGAKLVHVGPLWATALAWYAHPARASRHHYFLFAGCSNPVATFGYVNAAFELREQIERRRCPEPRLIVVAAGTAATLAGLTLGCALAGLRSQVVGVRVSPARVGLFPSCTVGAVTQIMARCRRQLASLHPEVTRVSVPGPTLRDDWYGDGYGVSSGAVDAAILRASHSALRLEPTYTGKAFAAFLALRQQERGPCLFWNTYNSRPWP